MALDAESRRRHLLIALVLACFFLSGTAGLVYEVLWVRMIDKIIGSAPFAVATVLSVFMGGLALGSFLAGRLIDRLRSRDALLRFYGVLELTVGLYALLLPLLIHAVIPFYRLIYDRLYPLPVIYHSLTFLGCVLLLIPPTTLMGATLPALCRYYVFRLDHLGQRTGLLYGLNTIGAALGTLLCGFFLIPRFGLHITLWSAAAVNISAGALCYAAASMKTDSFDDAPFNDQAPPSETLRIPCWGKDIDDRQVSWALVLFAVSGFAAMSCQVLWIRLIGLLIGPTTYSFTLVVATFIIGLAAGGILFGWLADRVHSPFNLLTASQLGAAASALLVGHWLGNSQFFFAKLIYTFHQDFTRLLWVQSLALAVLLFVPTLLLGAVFPLVNRLYIRSTAAIGRSIGTAYAVNTIGAIVGAFTAGFILIPLTGKQDALGLIFLFQFSLAALGLIYVNIRQPSFARQTIMAGILLLTGFFLCMHYPAWNRDILSRGWYRDFDALKAEMRQTGWIRSLWNGADLLAKHRQGVEVVFSGEGPGGFTTVERETTSVGTIEYALFNSGKADASSHGDRSTQTLSAHIPLLFCPRPENVMVLGLASGMTPGETLYYPVKRLDILEINDQVAEACRRFFAAWNNNCLDDSRTRLILQDGRNHLSLTGEHYDVIISEPSNPWMAGLANLYTRDFFRLVKNRLTDHGLFAQWIQSYELDWDTFALLGRTFASVFPGGRLIKIGPVDYLLLAHADGRDLDCDTARGNLRFTRQSANAAFAGVDFLAHLFITEDIKTFFGNGPIHTDNRPLLEFSAPRHLFAGTLDIDRKSVGRRRLSDTTREMLEQKDADDDLLDLVAFAAGVNAPLFSHIRYDALLPDQQERYLDIVRSFCARELVPSYSLFDCPEPKRVCGEIQAARIRDRIDKMGGRPQDYYNLGLALVAVGRHEEAFQALIRALRLDPAHEAAHLAFGLLLADSGKWDEAISTFQNTARLVPDQPEAFRYLGMACARKQDWAKALANLSRALELDPNDVPTLNERGAVYFQKGQIREALADFSKALRLNPEDAESHNSMAMALVADGQYEKAAGHLRRAIQIRPDNENLRYNLGQVLRRLNRRDGYDRGAKSRE